MVKIKVGNTFATIDNEDYDKVSVHKWYLDKDGYAVTAYKVDKKTYNLKMHQLIFGKKRGFVIDHINNVKLDNTKTNLRHITRQANAMNMEKQCGVYWNEQRKTYIVQIKINGKTKHIGCKKNKEDAVKLRQQAEEKYFKPIINNSEEVLNGCC